MPAVPKIGFPRRHLKIETPKENTIMKNTTTTQPSQSTIAPEHLSPRSQQLWNHLQPAHAKSLERQTLLRAGLECLDRMDEAARLIKTQGLTSETKSTGAVHLNPLVRIEKDARQQFIAIWCLLRLTFNPLIDGR
jgi:phage terminase small subunit